MPHSISERKIPYRTVTIPPTSAPSTVLKNPTNFETAAIWSSENPSEMYEDEKQNHRPNRPAHEIRERPGDCSREPLAHRFAPAAGFGHVRGLGGERRLRAEEQHQHAPGLQRRHGRVGCIPARARGDHQRARSGNQHRNPVAGLDHSGARPLQIERKEFHAVCVNHDVLGRREERHDQSQRGHQGQVAFWIAGTKSEYCGHQSKLDADSPTAPSPQGKRRRQPVHERRPHELERVGRGY
jgi:hypothetical protein